MGPNLLNEGSGVGESSPPKKLCCSLNMKTNVRQILCNQSNGKISFLDLLSGKEQRFLHPSIPMASITQLGGEEFATCNFVGASIWRYRDQTFQCQLESPIDAVGNKAITKQMVATISADYTVLQSFVTNVI